MYLRLLLVFSFLFVGNLMNGQNCPIGDLTFSSQADIDDFLVSYPNCTEIEGNVTIEELDFSPLTNLLGLQNITTINGFLKIRENEDLTSLSGLGNLNTVGGFINISWNINLSNLSTLINLTNVFGSVSISGNHSLINLSGLNNLTIIGSDLFIGNNHNLDNLSGLDNISVINGFLAINNNANLTSLSGLDNITTVSDYLAISINFSLTNLSGLENLQIINGNLILEHNTILFDISALNNLDSIGNLRISDNSNLAYCCIPGITNHIENQGNAEIWENASGCNSVEEVETNCEMTSIQNTENTHMNIFPNPTRGFVNIEISSDISYQVELLDVTGKILLTGKNLSEINLSAYPAAVYFLEITDSDTKTKIIEKLIVTN